MVRQSSGIAAAANSETEDEDVEGEAPAIPVATSREEAEKAFAQIKVIIKYRLALIGYLRNTLSDPDLTQEQKQKVYEDVAEKLQASGEAGSRLYKMLD